MKMNAGRYYSTHLGTIYSFIVTFSRTIYRTQTSLIKFLNFILLH